MCLINFHFQDHSTYKLIITANRDEGYNRPTKEAHFWEDTPYILAGRDLLQMGTWLGITKQGRFAALTNYRDPRLPETGRHSRGAIVRDFLSQSTETGDFLTRLQKHKSDYAGFNLLVGNSDELVHYNNILDKITKIAPGTHGLSNHTLNTPWPKVTKGRERLSRYFKDSNSVSADKLFEITADAERAPDHMLPDTGVGIELERMLSPLFITSPEYGTRSSTVLLIDKNNNVTFVERTFEKGRLKQENTFEFTIQPSI
ncbi:NRDE family protein [Oceanobacillus piezotolerans]|uniref:NRDE family protein n=1 Tax=Oceanobacillus piezotolerans TaxID=2448030 RepID=A0A498D8H1_9BACI|nr:NRDE family protein [Oceanobacillus piezotolerans]RLL44921.1 NRDE family protein [Oceanobacillus piezotolerans]